MEDDKKTTHQTEATNGSKVGDKSPFVGAVAKTVGLVVEASSLLAGDPMAALEREVAEVEVEDALDGVDLDDE